MRIKSDRIEGSDTGVLHITATCGDVYCILFAPVKEWQSYFRFDASETSNTWVHLCTPSFTAVFRSAWMNSDEFWFGSKG